MRLTIGILIGGFSVTLVGTSLMGTLLGVRGTLESFTNSQLGLIMSSYYTGFVIGALFAPRVIRNVGHIRSYSAFAALAAATCLAFGLTVGVSQWVVLRLISGLAGVALYTAVESWLNQQCSPAVRGRVFALYMTATLLAMAFGQLLLTTGDPRTTDLFALAALLICIGVIPIAITRLSEPKIESIDRPPPARLFQISPLGVAGVVVAGIITSAFWSMTPVFAQRLNLDLEQLALLMTLTILGGAALQWPIGHLSDRFDRRGVLVATSLAIAGTALATAWLVTHQQSWLYPAGFVYGGLMFALYAISVAHANDHLAPAQVLEATRGLILMYGVGAILGPLAGGLVMDQFGPIGLPGMSATAATLLGLYGLYRMTRRPPPGQRGEFVPIVRTSGLALEHQAENVEPDRRPQSP